MTIWQIILFAAVCGWWINVGAFAMSDNRLKRPKLIGNIIIAVVSSVALVWWVS